MVHPLVFVTAILFFLGIWLLVETLTLRESARLTRVQNYLERQGNGQTVSFRGRVLIPMGKTISGFAMKFYPPATIARMDNFCELAGRPLSITGSVLAGSKFLSAMFFALAAFLFPLGQMRLPAALVAGGLGYVIPGGWISLSIRKRLDAARKSMADAMDLMVISVEAGLGMDAALQRVGARFKGPLGEVFSRAMREISLGSSREDALRGISERLPLDEMRALTSNIIQAERLGTSIGAVLRIQAASLRKQRRLRAEEHARKAPVKILFPLVLFIFPSLFVVMLGPAMIQIMETLK